MVSKKKTAKREPIFKPGHVERELERLAINPHQNMFGQDYRHAIGMLAAGMLMIIDRLPEEKK